MRGAIFASSASPSSARLHRQPLRPIRSPLKPRLPSLRLRSQPTQRRWKEPASRNRHHHATLPSLEGSKLPETPGHSLQLSVEVRIHEVSGGQRFHPDSCFFVSPSLSAEPNLTSRNLWRLLTRTYRPVRDSDNLRSRRVVRT